MYQILNRPLSRRSVLASVVAMSGTALLSSCGSQSSGSSGQTQTSLRVGVPTDIVLASALAFTPQNQPLRRTVFDYLIDRQPDGSYQPGLATEWEWSDDNRQLVLTLRDDVTFHDGRAFGPEDVLFTIQTALTPESGAQVATLLQRGGTPSAMGKNQVSIEFDEPFPSYLDAFAALPIVDPNTYGNYASGEKVVGTGPFAWGSWSAGRTMELTKNADYWNGPASFDDVTFSVFTEPQAMLAALRSGDLDLADRVVPRDATTLEKTGDFWVDTPTGHDIYVGCNATAKPLDDLRVRQAINYSIDRQRIVDQVYNGVAEPSCVPWPADTPGVTPEMVNQYPLDLEKAKQLIKEAGAEGTVVKTTPSPADPSFGAIHDIVAFGLTEIGLMPETVTFDAAEYPKRIQAGDLPGLFIGQVALTTLGPTTTVLTANPFRAEKNTHNFTPPEYAELVETVVTADDDDARAGAVGELTSYLVEQSVHDTVVQASSPVVGVTGLSEVQVDVTQALRLEKATLKE